MDPQESQNKPYGENKFHTQGKDDGKHRRLCIALCVWFLLQTLFGIFTLVTAVTSNHGCMIVCVGTIILFCCGDCYQYQFVLS